MADLVKNPVSFVGVRRPKFGRKGPSSFGVFSERAIELLTLWFIALLPVPAKYDERVDFGKWVEH
ncbi:hypothetical protein [Microcoleus sp. B3-D7]|uniref:hypothetical protein n=1 Tax=Microcoleus sp. B3-D7 TaxID=2818659 RepID=UPI002FD077DF